MAKILNQCKKIGQKTMSAYEFECETHVSVNEMS